MKQYISITAEAHTPPYKIHRYFARRPWNVFSQLVEIYSNPSDIVLDPFMGGGVTIYEGLKLNRKIIGYDLNPLSVFIVENMIKKNEEIQAFEDTYSKIKAYLEYLYSDYEVVNLQDKQLTLSPQKINVEWNELAFNVFCNYCGEKILLSNENKIKNGRYSCRNSRCKGNKENGGHIEPKDCKRDFYSYIHSIVIHPDSSKKIKIPFDEERIRVINSHIKFLKKEIKKKSIEIPKDKIPLQWDRQLEDLLERKNIIYFQDLFTEKNLYINLLLKKFINNLQIDKNSHALFRLIFSSSLRDTNLMAFTNDFWQSGTPTTWSKHAYWIPSQFCEVNVLSAFDRAYRRMKASLIYNSSFNYSVNYATKFDQLKDGKNVYMSASSIADSSIPDNFVDAIVTDPPYGSNVQYLELSHFWYIWNRDLYSVKEIDFSKEAVSNRKKNFIGAKTMYDYEANLSKVFNKCYKILKPNKYMVLTFNNKDISAWIAIVVSILKAGFIFENLYFQDGIKNYKQTAHTKYEGSPFGDYIYVFKKEAKANKILVRHKNENGFKEELDKVLSRHLKVFEKGKHNRDEVIKDMFLEAIPLIEMFVRSNLAELGKHSLYSFFNKKYLNRIYG